MRVLNTEFGRTINAVDQVLEVINVPKSLTNTETVRVELADGERPLLINDSLDTEFEVVS